MAPSCQPPTKTKSSKRKRRGSDGRPPLPIQNTGIKAPSRSPGQQRQLSLAGLSDDDEDPSQYIKYFPHRGVQSEAFELSSSDEDCSPESGGLSRNSSTSGQPKAMRRGSYLDILLRSTHQLLDEGKISKSAKLFGVILQLKVNGKPIDIRQHNLWAIGAEIIMRTGEEENLERLGLQNRTLNCAESHTHIRVPARWGSDANISRLQAYMKKLIQQYPYDRKFPRTVSAIDFQAALLACSIFNCHAEFVAEISYLGEGQELRRAGEISRVARSDSLDETTDHDIHPCLRIERAQERAYRRITAIVDEMKTLMENPPYSGNKYFLYLQATASFMIADLLTPSSGDKDIGAKVAKIQEQANVLLQRVMDHAEHSTSTLLDVSVQQLCRNQPLHHQTFHISLPIRGM